VPVQTLHAVRDEQDLQLVLHLLQVVPSKNVPSGQLLHTPFVIVVGHFVKHAPLNRNWPAIQFVQIVGDWVQLAHGEVQAAQLVPV
jgi:hypothetical protein